MATNKSRLAKMTNDYELLVYNSNGDRIYHNEKTSNSSTVLTGLGSGDYKIVLLQDGNIYEQTLNAK